MRSLALLVLFAANARAVESDLPSWNDGAAKKAILDFVRVSTDAASPRFIKPEERIATFDHDGTLWVEHPLYTQVIYCLDQVPKLVKRKPELADVEPWKSVLHGKFSTLAKADLEKILEMTLSGMTVVQFEAEVQSWLATARHPRWKRPYTELVYQPMLELMEHLRKNGFRTYIATGGGQDFVRVFSQEVYGIPPEQVIGTMGSLRFGHDATGKPILTKEPRLLLDDNHAGKPEGIWLMIGRPPRAAFGNSVGDREMLEFTNGLGMLVLHDDAEREYAYGPAQGLPDSPVGNFPQTLYDQAKKSGWLIISMKQDWKRLFRFER